MSVHYHPPEQNSSRKQFSKPKRSPYLISSPSMVDGGHLVGKSPLKIPLRDLQTLGHPQRPLKAIRAKCLDCCCGSEGEARKCVVMDCPLWPLRMGRNVFHGNSRPKNG